MADPKGKSEDACASTDFPVVETTLEARELAQALLDLYHIEGWIAREPGGYAGDELRQAEANRSVAFHEHVGLGAFLLLVRRVRAFDETDGENAGEYRRLGYCARVDVVQKDGVVLMVDKTIEPGRLRVVAMIATDPKDYLTGTMDGEGRLLSIVPEIARDLMSGLGKNDRITLEHFDVPALRLGAVGKRPAPEVVGRRLGLIADDGLG